MVNVIVVIIIIASIAFASYLAYLLMSISMPSNKKELQISLEDMVKQTRLLSREMFYFEYLKNKEKNQ